MTDDNQPKSNVPELSVSELAFSLKRTLEETYSRVRVRGELSRVKVVSSGHMYSDLKDDQAVINLICWKGVLSKLSVKPEEGLEVICTGKISSYPARSNYQLIIESMEMAGEGALLKMLEERRKKLAAEGLFDENRKKPLPFLPRRIGVVTSPTGAVIRDIMHRLDDRFPTPVFIYPVLVQGDGASDQIADAIRKLNSLPKDSPYRPDLLIVGRGGGSLEDLMPFNEENVVRAAAECDIPLISAVGHETDTTLIDFVSDRRAPTPTGAAEIAVPRRIDLMAGLDDSQRKLMRAADRLITQQRSRLENNSIRLGKPESLFETRQQKLDIISQRYESLFDRFIQKQQSRHREAGIRLRSPQNLIKRKHDRFTQSVKLLGRSGAAVIRDKSTRLQTYTRVLSSLSYQNVLERGFVVVRDQDGKPITDPKNLKADNNIRLEYKDGKMVSAIISGNGVQKGNPKPKKKPLKKGDNNQQTLF